MDITRVKKIQNKTTIPFKTELKVSWRGVQVRYLIANRSKGFVKTFASLYATRDRTEEEDITYHVPLFPPQAPEQKKWSYKQRMVAISIFACVISFGGGMAAVLKENKTQAEMVASSTLATEHIEAVDFTEFLNTSLKNLESYNQKPAGPDQLVLRKARLKTYLEEKASPFAQDETAIDAFLAAPHMNLILAISYAESTMGQKCYYNNCSGIGGYPPNLRKYKEVRNWVVDLNDLLERKYKDWTISEMCGVYVQPCNTQWPKAISQVLNELTQIGF